MCGKCVVTKSFDHFLAAAASAMLNNAMFLQLTGCRTGYF